MLPLNITAIPIMNHNQPLTVKQCFDDNKHDLKLKLLSSSVGLKHIIEDLDLNRPGLLLAGFTKTFAEKKIQIFGITELSYLADLNKPSRIAAFSRLISMNIPCLFISNNGKLDDALIEIAETAGIAIIQSPYPTIQVYHMLFEYINNKFAPSMTVHGTLVDVYGIGVLFTGRSGIGKSEIALDLVERGHRLVADDIVCIYQKHSEILIGTSQKILQNVLEIRGVGIIDIFNTFGIRAIRGQKRIEIEVRLEDHGNIETYDRLGIDEEFIEYLNVKIPLIHLPIFPGKNVTVISEVIALKTMQKIYGIRPEREFIQRLNKTIKQKDKIRKYLSGDME